MKLNIQVNSIGGDHVHFTLFLNGKCGDLCMNKREFRAFVRKLTNFSSEMTAILTISDEDRVEFKDL